MLLNNFFKALKIQLTSLRQHSNEKYENLTASLFTGPNNETLMNFTVITFAEVEKLFVVMSVRFPTSNKDTEYENEVMKSTVDICKVFKRATGNFAVKIFTDNLKNSNGFPFECPLKPHTVQLKNLDFAGMLLPSYLLPGKTKFAIEIIMKGKIPDHKQLVYFHTLKIYFEST